MNQHRSYLCYNLIRNKKKTNLKQLNTMKKLIYSILFCAFIGLSFSACTEEEVAPATELDNGGAGATDPVK